ncbi:hypothetical protein ABEB36_007761 [Hypothenemus hampei]|uniref:Uncharacterized protein n=1 Tax=Hypothenemus hampei TaxID=57062 RepID=A0ABD1EXJ0_HYPHA
MRTRKKIIIWTPLNNSDFKPNEGDNFDSFEKSTFEEAQDNTMHLNGNAAKRSHWNKSDDTKWKRNVTKKCRDLGQSYSTKKGSQPARI